MLKSNVNVIDVCMFIVAACYFFEQVFYRIAGSYPYRYGLVIKTIYMPNVGLRYWENIKERANSLIIKIDLQNSKVYIRYRYPCLAIGPLLFIGQIEESSAGSVARIRIGPLSAVFLLFFIAHPFVSLNILSTPISQIINLLSLGAIVAFLYLVLVIPMRAWGNKGED